MSQWKPDQERYSTEFKVDNSGEIIDDLVSDLNKKAREPDLWGYDPHEGQKKFHSSKAGGRVILGGNRSGKSYSSVVEMLLYATGSHPYRVVPRPPLALRHVAVDRPNGIEKILYELYKKLTPQEFLIEGSFEKSWKKDPPRLNLSNGSYIEFMSYEQDLDKHAGASRHAIAFDEEPDPAIFDENMMRLVDTNGDWWIAQTPVEGFSWVYFDFYQPIVEEKQEGFDIEFFQFPTRINKKISTESLDRLTVRLRFRGEQDMKVRTEGAFVALTGLIYPFQRQLHVVNYKVDRNLPIQTSMDHGMRHPTAWGWFQVDYDGNIFLFHEYYCKDPDVFIHQHSAHIHMFERINEFNVEYRIGDPSIQNKNPVTHTSVQTEYANQGVYIGLGNNDVDAGIQRVAQLLRPNDRDYPRLYIDESCVNTIREFRSYRWDDWANKKMAEKKEAKPTPKKKDDHCMDMTRYFCMSRPWNDTSGPTLTPPITPPNLGGSYSVSWEPYPDSELLPSKPAPDLVPSSYSDDELGNDW